MKLLFTSDLHGLLAAYERFAELLVKDGYDAGIIAGDLMTHLSPIEVRNLLQNEGVTQDDLLEELDSPEASLVPETPTDRIYAEGIKKKATELRDVLQRTRKPVFFVMGNDDGIVGGGIEWPSEGMLRGVNQRRIDFDPYNFVGYQYTNPFVGGWYEKNKTNQARDLKLLERLVDKRTILITHGPPFGVLDRAHNHSLGSKPLARFVRRRRPHLHLFGHIHQSFGVEGFSINGAFPLKRQFVSIDVETRRTTFIDAVPHNEAASQMVSEEQQRMRTCSTCQNFSAEYCHIWNDRREPTETFDCWEPRREVDGWTIWEVLDREG